MSVNFVLLTNTAGTTLQRSIGAYQVAYQCRINGYTCQVIDFTDHFSIEELHILLEKFVGNETLAIGVSTSFYSDGDNKDNYVSTSRHYNSLVPEYIRQLLTKVKSTYPALKIIAGGAQSFKITDDPLFDAVFHGYSEQSVVDYLDRLKSGLKQIWPTVGKTQIIDGATAHFDIQNLAHKWHAHDCIIPNETLPIEISRGCIFKCKFCSYPLNGKKKFDYLRDPLQIKDELIKNYELYNTTNYYFTDDTFNDSTHKLEQLHRVITELPFKIKFVTYLRLDLIHSHRAQIDLLKEMGLGSAFFGIETLHAKAGKAIGKGLSPNKVKDFIFELHDNHWKKEVPFTCSFIVGLPHETATEVRETYEWCKTAPINDVWFPLFIRSDTHFKSEFDVNFAKYGYVADADGNWTNDNFSYSTALAMAEEFNQENALKEKFSSGWFLFSLLTYGYSIEELKTIPIKNLPWQHFKKRQLRFLNQYKKIISNLS